MTHRQAKAWLAWLMAGVPVLGCLLLVFGFIYHINELPLKMAWLEAYFKAMQHPAQTRLLHRKLEHGPSDGGSVTCLTWIQAAEAREFNGNRATIEAFYKPPLELVFGADLIPVGRTGRYEIHGDSLEEWHASPNQRQRVYWIALSMNDQDCGG